jgi:hypothetical protein
MEHGLLWALTARNELAQHGLNSRSARRDFLSPVGRAINLLDDSSGIGVMERFLRSARIYVLKT